MNRLTIPMRLRRTYALSAGSCSLLRPAFVLVALGCLPGIVHSQDPFGQPAGQAGVGNDPFGAAGQAAAAAPKQQAAAKQAIEEPQETDVIVLAIEASKPETPDDLFSAVQMMLNIGRLDMAQKYATAIVDSNPDDATLAALHEKYGTASLRRLTQYRELAKPATQLLNASLNAANRLVMSDQQISALIQRATVDSRSERILAIQRLQLVGEKAVGMMLSVLDDDNQQASHRRIQESILSMGDAAIEPMAAAIKGGDEQLQGTVIEICAARPDSRLMPFLLRPYHLAKDGSKSKRYATRALQRLTKNLPSREHSIAYLQKRVRAIMGGEMPRRPGYQGNIELWAWNKEASTAKSTVVSKDIARRVFASELADDLAAIDAEGKDSRHLKLAASLELIKAVNGFDALLSASDASIRALAEEYTLPEMLSSLELCLKSGHVTAATALCELIGQTGDAKSVLGSKSPLVTALRHSNRRIAFAAVEAVLSLNPESGFAGSSYVLDAAKRILQTQGQPRALVVHPSSDYRQTTASAITEAGFLTDVIASGREAYAMTVSTDYDLLFISSHVYRPDIIELVQILRRDTRTASIPIGVLAPPEDLNVLREKLLKTPNAMAFVEPYRPQFNVHNIQRLITKAGIEHVHAAERLRAANRILLWLSRLAEDPARYRYYELGRLEDPVISCLHVDGLNGRAARLLGGLATHAGQVALVNFASHGSYPAESRMNAAKSFEASVKKKRVLLTTDEIKRQYDRYNASETADAATQQILGNILDSIEAPTKGKSSDDP